MAQNNINSDESALQIYTNSDESRKRLYRTRKVDTENFCPPTKREGGRIHLAINKTEYSFLWIILCFVHDSGAM